MIYVSLFLQATAAGPNPPQKSGRLMLIQIQTWAESRGIVPDENARINGP